MKNVILPSIVFLIYAASAVAVDKYRYHFGAHMCVQAPDGVCEEAYQACNSCSQAKQPNVLHATLSFPSVALAGTARDKRQSSCYRATLQDKPSWISTATWVDRKSEIMVVDPVKNQVLLYTITGQQTDFPSSYQKKGVKVDSTGRGKQHYILKLVGPSGIIFDDDLKYLEREVDFRFGRAGKSNGLGALYDWLVSGSRFFAIGMASPAKSTDRSKDHASGFIQAEIDGNPLVIDDVNLEVSLDYLDYYFLGHRNVASVGDEGYFLRMGGRAEIVHVSKKGGPAEVLNVIPRELAQVPRLKATQERLSDAEALFKEIAGYSIPVGIYGFRGSLYLLGRIPSGNETAWWLYKIDLRSKRVVRVLRIPSSAEHLTVVPSPNNWFIFEKGSVTKTGSQLIASLLVIPSDWVEASSSSPLTTPGKVTCLPLAGTKVSG